MSSRRYYCKKKTCLGVTRYSGTIRITPYYRITGYNSIPGCYRLLGYYPTTGYNPMPGFSRYPVNDVVQAVICGIYNGYVYVQMDTTGGIMYDTSPVQEVHTNIKVRG